MQFLRRDSDLGTKTELFTVGETSRRVDRYGGRIDLLGKHSRMRKIAGHDRLGVPRPETIDVFDRARECRHNGDTHFQIEELSAEVIVGRSRDARTRCKALRCVIADQLDHLHGESHATPVGLALREVSRSTRTQLPAPGAIAAAQRAVRQSIELAPSIRHGVLAALASASDPRRMADAYDAAISLQSQKRATAL